MPSTRRKSLERFRSALLVSATLASLSTGAMAYAQGGGLITPGSPDSRQVTGKTGNAKQPIGVQNIPGAPLDDKRLLSSFKPPPA